MSKILKKTESYNVWRKFIKEGIITDKSLPVSIKASWERCRKIGFRPQEEITPTRLDEEAIKKRIETHPNLHSILEYHYRTLEKHFDFVPFSMFFSDVDGYILSIYGDDQILKLSERGTVKLGSNVSESAIGTNAPGISIIEGKPSSVNAEEHYSFLFHWASCFAIPIVDYQKNMLGCLDCTVRVENRKKLEHLIPQICSIANSLQLEVFLKERLQEIEIWSSYFQSTFDYADKILILISRRGDILNLNRKAEKYFHINFHESIAKNIKEVLNIDNSKFNSLFDKSHVVRLSRPRSVSSKPLSAQCIPIVNRSGNPIAYLLKLKKEKTNITITRDAFSTAQFHFSDIIGKSEQILGLIEKAKKVARTSSNVLIEGETGTGKELLAHSIHNESKCCHGPFVAINCSAISPELIESELFGYERGAYTGAKREGNIGKFELANGGTIFLDEIHAMSLSAQMKILRVIENRHVIRVGGTYPISLDIRIIAASSKHLEDEVKNGNFLSALFFRLSVVRLHIPKLKERRDDIPLLVSYFIQELNKNFMRSIQGVTSEALNALIQYSWPGNVRELRSCLESAFNFCSGDVLTLKDLHFPGGDIAVDALRKETRKGQDLEGVTRNLMAESLRRFGKVKEAANFLGIPVSTFYKKMKKFGLEK